MTIAALEDLRKDGEDEVIGNGGIYRKTYPHANMGDAVCLETFLSYIRENYESERVLLISGTMEMLTGGFALMRIMVMTGWSCLN